MIKNYIVNAVVALLLIIGVGLISNKSAPEQSNVQNLGGLSERDIQAVSLKVGPNGEKTSSLDWGTCYLDPYATTIAASSTASVDCQGTLAVDARAGNSGLGGEALTGVTSSSKPVVTLSTTTAGNTVGGIRIAGASASTTAGHIELRIVNQTGTTYTWSTTAGTASGTAQFIAPR